MSMKYSNGTIGDRTRDLRTCRQCLNRLRHRVQSRGNTCGTCGSRKGSGKFLLPALRCSVGPTVLSYLLLQNGTTYPSEAAGPIDCCPTQDVQYLIPYHISTWTACSTLISDLHGPVKKLAQSVYVVRSKSFRPDQLFKVTELKQLCYFST